MVDGSSFEVRAGEIFGIAGVAGNGQDELVEALTGLRRADRRARRACRPGRDQHSSARAVRTRGRLHPRRPAALRARPPYPIDDNLVLDRLLPCRRSRGAGSSTRGAISEHAKELIPEFDIRTPSGDVPAATLSGGNQQKVIVAREFSRRPHAARRDQPTRGIDVGSIEFIHKQIVAKRDAGTAVLLVSAELDEVMELSDRIGVMYRGRLVAILDAETAQKDQVGLIMATGQPGRRGMTETANPARPG